MKPIMNAQGQSGYYQYFICLYKALYYEIQTLQ